MSDERPNRTDDAGAGGGNADADGSPEPTYIVAQVRGERIEVSKSVLDELGGVAAADDMTAEAWLERNIGPSILYGEIVQLVDEFRTAADVPSATRIARWRTELTETRTAAEEVWGTPTLDYADQVREAAGRLELLLETLETSTAALEQHRVEYGADHELVEELTANVRQQATILHRVAGALTD